MPTRPLESIPATPASDADRAPSWSRAFRVEALATHLARAFGIAAIVVVVGAGVSIYTSVVGWKTCVHVEEGTQCREVHTYPFSVQVRSDIETLEGVPHGERREWHMNGVPWFSGQYEHGARVGTWTEWHSNGVPRFTGHYVNDRLSGFETWWFANGQREWQVQRLEGRRVGQETWWFEDGAVRRVGTYNAAGEKDGPFTVYNEEGAVRFSGLYSRGVLQAGGDGEIEGDAG